MKDVNFNCCACEHVHHTSNSVRSKTLHKPPASQKKAPSNRSEFRIHSLRCTVRWRNEIKKDDKMILFLVEVFTFLLNALFLTRDQWLMTLYTSERMQSIWFRCKSASFSAIVGVSFLFCLQIWLIRHCPTHSNVWIFQIWHKFIQQMTFQSVFQWNWF